MIRQSLSANGDPKQAERLGQDYKNPAETRKVYDNIHGFIYFPKYVWDFIDTSHFQRLRKIKQLSCLQYVFPGATHSRFEHSLGTAHLALTFLKALILNNPQLYEEQDIESAKKTLTIAGLLHDLGHGPYSHTFDSAIVTEITVKGEKGQQKTSKWKHEIASQVLFTHLVQKQGLKKHFSDRPQDIQRVRALIRGQPDGTRNWEFQIISNKINGIDVDKLDYFRRDAFHLGAKNIYIDHQLLFNEAKIIENQICYPTKYVETVHNIFYSRYKLYKNYYFNIVSKGIELMICDVLKQIEGKFKFRQSCERIFQDPSQYIKLNDNIIEKVQYIYDHLQENPHTLEAKQHLQKFAQAVKTLQQINKRKIYKFVREFHYFIRQGKDEQLIKFLQTQIKEQHIIKSMAQNGKIDRQLVRVVINQIGFGITSTNPLKKVGFFRKQINKLQKLPPEQIQSLSMLYSNAYLERSIKIFIKSSDSHDSQLFEAVNTQFQKYIKNLNDFCSLKYKSNALQEGPIGTPYSKNTEQNQQRNYRPFNPLIQT